MLGVWARGKIGVGAAADVRALVDFGGVRRIGREGGRRRLHDGPTAIDAGGVRPGSSGRFDDRGPGVRPRGRRAMLRVTDDAR